MTALDPALDEAVRAAVEPDVADGEIVTTWLTIVGTRAALGGGVVITIPADPAMPMWEVRGLLTAALADLDRRESADQ